MSDTDTGVRVRKLPYPYRAMLAICSDLDETPNRHVYLEIMRYLNSTETTSMGLGVGLEVGNSIYFDMPPDQFSYWNTDEAGREMIQTLIRSGHIDCLHSYGDLAGTRAHAERALEELRRHGCELEVWIDHSVAPSNFGSDIMRGFGDIPGSEVYHADLTCDYGIEYVWRGRVTSIVGQETGRSLRGIANSRHAVRSVKTVAKELGKGVLGRLGNAKYAMHGSNELIRRTRLRDGREVYEFLRSNPYWGGVEHAATADGLAHVLTRRMLESLIEREGVCILYTHLGKIERGDESFGLRTRDALRLLADFHHDRQILVTTTRRLLGFHRAVRDLSVTAGRDDGKNLLIEVNTKTSTTACNGEMAEPDLDGLTFYLPDPDTTRVTLNGREVLNLRRNGSDQTGQRSVSIPWPTLQFPNL